MLTFRFATEQDVDLYYEWANDRVARENSYNSEPIEYASHVKWFNKRVTSEGTFFYVFSNENNEAVGSVRIEKEADEARREATISVVVDKHHRGKSYATSMLAQASSDFLERMPGYRIRALIFVANLASFKSFTAAGYTLVAQENIKGIPSYIMEKTKL